MRTLRNHLSGVLVAVLALGMTAGCGDSDDEPSTATQSQEPSSPDSPDATDEPSTEPGGDAVPAGLASALEAVGITVTPVGFGADELSEKQATKVLKGGLGPEFLADGANAYSVEVVASDDDGLSAGDRTWLMHLPGVGTRSEPDMVVFLDAASGADLATVYVSPAA